MSRAFSAKRRETVGSARLSGESPGDLQHGDSESLARRIFQLRFTTKIAPRFPVKLITKVFFPCQKQEGTEPAGAPKYRTAEMLHYPDFTLAASSTGGPPPNRVLNGLHTGSGVSVGTLLLLILGKIICVIYL